MPIRHVKLMTNLCRIDVGQSAVIKDYCFCHGFVTRSGDRLAMEETAPLCIENLQGSSKSLRIALVTETYAPDVNGVALTLQRIVEGLRSLGHDVLMVRPRNVQRDALSDGVQDGSVFVKGMPIPMYPDLKLGLPAKRALIKLWTYRRPDVVHIATEGPLGWSAVQAAKKLRLPMTSDFRTNFHAYSAFYGFGWLKSAILSYMRKFHNTTDCTMVPTSELKQALAGLGFERLSVIPRGIETGLFDPAKRSEPLRQSWGADPGTLVVLSVGRLAAEKNLEVTVRAYKALQAQGIRVKMVFVGDGPIREKLARLCPDAVFCGMRRGEDLAAHYASGDLFVFPSVTETFGNVTLEAMASGLPVVAFNCAAARQLIRSDENGVLVAMGQEDDFVESVVRLAVDEVLRREIGRQARTSSLENGWPEVLRKTETVLRAVAERPAPSNF